MLNWVQQQVLMIWQVHHSVHWLQSPGTENTTCFHGLKPSLIRTLPPLWNGEIIKQYHTTHIGRACCAHGCQNRPPRSWREVSFLCTGAGADG